MKPICCNLIRSTAAVCVLMVSGIISAQDGVVRLSDQTTGSPQDAGVIRLSDRNPANIRPAGYLSPAGCTSVCGEYPMSTCQPGCFAPAGCSDACGFAPCDGCGTNTYSREWMTADFGGNGSCYSCGPGGSCHAGCHPGCSPGNGSCHWGSSGDSCQACQWGSHGGCPNCHGGCPQCSGYGAGYGQRMNTLFAQPVCTGTGCRTHDMWRGHSASFLAKNARLSNKLFGWLIPSGHSGQGLPPAGKYHMTYADQPDYADPRDAQLYAAQGYGIPLTVPLAPNVHHQYNYSWGVPASRITPISNYNPQTSPHPLYHQTWHSDLPHTPAGHPHTLDNHVRRTKEFFAPGHY